MLLACCWRGVCPLCSALLCVCHAHSFARYLPFKIPRLSYDGTATDTQYTADVLDWTERAVARIHAAGMLVIPNYSVIDLGNADVLRVTNLTDGILAEVRK